MSYDQKVGHLSGITKKTLHIFEKMSSLPGSSTAGRSTPVSADQDTRSRTCRAPDVEGVWKGPFSGNSSSREMESDARSTGLVLCWTRAWGPLWCSTELICQGWNPGQTPRQRATGRTLCPRCPGVWGPSGPRQGLPVVPSCEVRASPLEDMFCPK